MSFRPRLGYITGDEGMTTQYRPIQAYLNGAACETADQI
jgi:hypothetical protein